MPKTAPFAREARVFLTVAACAAATAASPAFAEQLALEVPSWGAGGGGWAFAGAEYGYAFQVNAPVQVTALACYTLDSRRLGHHVVRLWRDGGELLATATVTLGSPVIGDGSGSGFGYEPIEPLALDPGSTYVVGSSPVPEEFFYLTPAFYEGPEIQFIEGRYSEFPGDSYPALEYAGLAAFGGNLLYEPLAAAAVASTGDTPHHQGLQPSGANPFAVSASLRYTLPDGAREGDPVTLRIYDVNGRMVAELASGIADRAMAGGSVREASWTPSGLAAGLYIARLQAGASSSVQRLVYLP